MNPAPKSSPEGTANSMEGPLSTPDTSSPLSLGGHLTPRRRWIFSSIAIVLLVLSALLSLLLQNLDYEQDIPSEDWGAAAKHIRDAFEPGDIVRVAPHWSDDARVFLAGVPIDSTRVADPDVLGNHRRVWVIAGFGMVDEPPGLMPRAFEMKERLFFGEVELLRFDVPQEAEIAFHFVDHIAAAKVLQVKRGGSTEECKRWDSGKNAWACKTSAKKPVLVGPRTMSVGEGFQRCIHAEALPNKGWLEVHFPEVPLAATLRGRVGLDKGSSRSKRGGVTDFEVWIGGKKEYSTELQRTHDPYNAFSINTSELEGKRAEVIFRIHASKPKKRILCFNAVIPGKRPPPQAIPKAPPVIQESLASSKPPQLPVASKRTESFQGKFVLKMRRRLEKILRAIKRKFSPRTPSKNRPKKAPPDKRKPAQKKEK